MPLPWGCLGRRVEGEAAAGEQSGRSPSLHLTVPKALLSKVRLREGKKPTDRFGQEARGQEKLEIFI